ncbi:hypothetical protein AB0C59_21320 [Streptomyces sp. NPDC048664]|uniref:hypothetical protein n=1 Tax=Streptomyces sp. NPDC048664 TaxID=3154505 RepID=UPI00341DCC39
MEKQPAPADDTDDEPKSLGDRLLAGAVIGGLVLLAVAAVALFFLLVLLGTAALFPQAIEFEGKAPVAWALVLLAPCACIAMAVAVPLRHLTRAALQPSPRVGNALDAACSWLACFLTGLMLLAWTPGVHAHSMIPAVVVATACALLGPAAERFRTGRGDREARGG